MHELDINSWHTAVDWANFCRDICTQWQIDHPVEIGGLDNQGMPTEVEIDETYFFHRKYHRGQRRDGCWVFGGVERHTGRCFTEIVPRRDAGTLLPLIETHILPGTRIISDMWPAYAGIGQINNGVYLHDTVNHTQHFVDPQDDTIHTQNIEGTWSHAKRKLRHQYGTSRALFPGYLNEFVWRKGHPERKFAHFLQCITEQYPV
jgi:transposase-like protein